MKMSLLFSAALLSWTVLVAAPVEKIKNERVVAQEETLRPGEADSVGSGLECAIARSP